MKRVRGVGVAEARPTTAAKATHFILSLWCVVVRVGGNLNCENVDLWI